MTSVRVGDGHVTAEEAGVQLLGQTSIMARVGARGPGSASSALFTPVKSPALTEGTGCSNHC